MDIHKELKAQEVTALVKGVERVVRRMIRVLLGYLSLAKLEELVRLVFVEEAEARLRREYPGRSVPMGQLALLTGLDSRQLNRIRAHAGYHGNKDREAAFENHSTPTTHLLDLWSTDPDYLDQETGHPTPLSVFGERHSIESLMKQSHFVRGVTPKAVADRLILSGAATRFDTDERLHLVTEKFLPSATSDVEGAIEVGFYAIGQLTETVLNNLQDMESGEGRLYQRCFWTNRLAPGRQDAFRQRMTELMRDFEDGATQALSDHEMNIETPSQRTAGIGLYYFEDAPNPANR